MILKVLGTVVILGAAVVAPEIVIPVGVALAALYAVK